MSNIRFRSINAHIGKSNALLIKEKDAEMIYRALDICWSTSSRALCLGM